MQREEPFNLQIEGDQALVSEVLSCVWQIGAFIASVGGVDVGPDEEPEYVSAVFLPMWRDPVTNGDRVLSALGNSVVGVGKAARGATLEGIANVAAAYCVQALRDAQIGVEARGWRNVCQAQFWLGISKGVWAQSQYSVSASIADIARRGSDVRHARNRSDKSIARQHYLAHRHEYKTLNAAAAEIFKLVEQEQRTVREWITEWEKEPDLPPRSRPKK